MIHAIIIDDEEKVLRSLELLIKKFVPEIRVVATSTDPVMAVKLIDDYRPDMVFLDISMPVLNGFEMLEKLSFRNFHLVFTTAHQEYAIQAIRKSALDYLLKPINTDEIIQIVEKVQKMSGPGHTLEEALAALNSIGMRHNSKIALPGKENTEYVFADEIIYLEANTRYSDVHTSQGKKTKVMRSLKEYEEQLCGKFPGFMRVHASYIVNLDFVMRYSKEHGGQVVVQGNKQIPVSKQKKEEVLKYFDIR